MTMIDYQYELARIKSLLPDLILLYPELTIENEIEPIKKGHGFATFKVRSQKDFFLKNLKNLEEIELQKTTDIFEELDTTHFPTCLPIKNEKGEFLTKLGKDNILLFPFISIEEPEINKNSFSQIGQSLSKLHTTNFTSRLKKYTATSNLEYFIKEYETLEKKGFKNFFSHINLIKSMPKDLPCGFIHSDLSFENVISTANEITGIIDFEEGGYGSFLSDISVAIIQMCFSNENIIANIQALLGGYKKNRILFDEEIKFFYNNLYLACMARNLWWAQKPDSSEKTKRITMRLQIAEKLEKIGEQKIKSLALEVFQ